MLRYLLDTHVILNWIDNPSSLPMTVQKIIDDSNVCKVVSRVSLWEIAIKQNLKKLSFQYDLEEILDELSNSEFEIMQIEDDHMIKYVDLPLTHKDPFDRMLIATSKSEDLIIITSDQCIKQYEVKYIWE